MSILPRKVDRVAVRDNPDDLSIVTNRLDISIKDSKGGIILEKVRLERLV